jgi:pimeloyl-ACP methyl ester carboxylesterase
MPNSLVFQATTPHPANLNHPARDEYYVVSNLRGGGESCGNPKGRAHFTAFYQELIGKRGFSRKPVLLPRSRGGLMLYNWAAEHPDSVGGIAGIYPVTNFRSWPGLDQACGAYGLSAAQLEEQLAPNPRSGHPILLSSWQTISVAMNATWMWQYRRQTGNLPGHQPAC